MSKLKSDTFLAPDMATSGAGLARARDLYREARDSPWADQRRQRAPTLSHSQADGPFREWVTLRRHDAAVTYGQAFLAVDFLIQRKGLPAVVEYCRRLGQSEDRLANLEAAFGQELSAFERECTTYLQSLLQ